MRRIRLFYSRVGPFGAFQFLALAAWWTFIIMGLRDRGEAMVLCGLIVGGFFLPLLLWPSLARNLTGVLTFVQRAQIVVVVIVIAQLAGLLPRSLLSALAVVGLTALYCGVVFWVYSSPALWMPGEPHPYARDRGSLRDEPDDGEPEGAGR